MIVFKGGTLLPLRGICIMVSTAMTMISSLGLRFDNCLIIAICVSCVIVQDSDQYLGDPGPSIMTEMEPTVTFTSSLRELPQHVSTIMTYSYI